MEANNTKSHSRLSLYKRRAYRAIATLLFVLMLAGCLTSYAAGPAEGESTNLPTTHLPSPTATLRAEPTRLSSSQAQDEAATLTLPAQARGAITTPAVTVVPNMSSHAFQATATATMTATATVTATATPTLEPTATSEQTATATPEPTTTPEPTATTAPEPTATSIPEPVVQATLAPFQAYAWVDNYYPAPGSVVTVYGILLKNGRPVNGAQMGVTWGYTHGEGYCTAYTGIDGRAACAQNIGAPLQNYWVYLDVVFIHKDELYYAKTSFLTDP